MINPHQVKPGYVRLSRNQIHVLKIYKPIYTIRSHSLSCRHNFKTATGALSHARSVTTRWIRLFDARASVQIARSLRWRAITAMFAAGFCTEAQAVELLNAPLTPGEENTRFDDGFLLHDPDAEAKIAAGIFRPEELGAIRLEIQDSTVGQGTELSA